MIEVGIFPLYQVFLLETWNLTEYMVIDIVRLKDACFHDLCLLNFDSDLSLVQICFIQAFDTLGNLRFPNKGFFLFFGFLSSTLSRLVQKVLTDLFFF